MKRIGILLSHPTQYHSPWFQELARRPELEIEVFYCFQPSPEQQGGDFGVAFEWDVPLLEGYKSTFLKNIAPKPGWDFAGCDTPEITRIIASRNHDVWILNGWRVKSDWQVMRACWRYKVPMMIRGDSNLLGFRSLPVRIVKRITLGKWIPRFARYLTVGKLNEEYYSHYGAASVKFFPVRHFVDNEWFGTRADNIRSNRLQLRRKWNIANDAKVFLFAGKFTEIKRPLDVIQALQQLQIQGENCHLLMVGDGPLRAACDQYVSQYNLRVSFAGFLNQGEMPSAYACSDVLVLPSGLETWGLVVNEAMACGLPAIVSDKVGCYPDLILPGKTGATFPAGDVKALTNVMSIYAQNPALVRAQGQAVKQHIQRYSIKDATDNTVAAVASLRRTRK